ncbi:23S rRNA-intervening sequence protein [anaerobic digester metagenome]
MEMKNYSTEIILKFAEEGSMRYQIEERLVDFSVAIIDFCSSFPHGKISDYFSDQLSRASVSAALNYGEAQGAESRKDFAHKLKISLKELREALVCLKIINKSSTFSKMSNGLKLQKEADELVSIFVASVRKLQSNMKTEK